MKNNTVIQLLIFLSAILFSGCKKDVIDNEVCCAKNLRLLNSYMNMQRPSDSYNYPICPCMKSWKELISNSDKIKACEIPPETLKNISTQAVIQALWEYPFFTDFLILVSEAGTRDLQKDMTNSISKNNAYKELLLRKDAGISLLERYKLVNPIAKEHRYHPLFLELLLTQTEFLQQLTNKEKKRLITTVLNKNKQRIASGMSENINIESVSSLLITRTMQSATYTPFITDINNNGKFKRYIKSGFFNGTDEDCTKLKEQIVEYGKKFIDN